MRAEAPTLAFLAAAFRDAGLPPPEPASLARVDGGSICRAFRVHAGAETFFCKWKPGGPPGLFAREKEGLEALAAATSLKIPRVVSAQDHGNDSPLLILEYLAPDPAEPDRGTWEALGRGLAQLHGHGAEAFGFPRDNYLGLTPQENAWTSGWAEFYARHRIGPLLRRLEADGRLRGAEAGLFRALERRLPVLLDHAPAPSLLHGDLWSGNFLATLGGPAIFDPAACYGDREAEWAMMLLFGGFPEAVLSAYQEAWPLPAEWRRRVPLYQVYHLLNHFLLFGGGYGEQARRIAAKFT